MFEKNLKELEKSNPKLAKKLRAYDIDEVKDIEVYESESKNVILSYKGFLLHSNEDPIREAKSIWHKTIATEMKDKDVQIIFGIGLGYLFKRAYINSSSRIVVLEKSIDILRFVLEHVDFSAELSDSRVYLTDEERDLYNYIEEKYLMGDKIEVLFLPQYLQFEKDSMLSISETLYQIIKDKGVDQTTLSKTSEYAVTNFINRTNDLEGYSSIDYLEDKFKGKTALIMAPGPSLKDEIEVIKQNQHKFITIAALPAAQTLIENGVEPNFVVVADPWEQTFKISNVLDKLQNTNFIVESRSDSKIGELKVNSKLLYFPKVDKLSEKAFAQLKQQDIQLQEPTSSVAILAYNTAKILGCSEIIFAGLDLAIIGNTLYSDGEELTYEGAKVIVKDEKAEKSYYTTKVKSADGSTVLTREDYLIFIKEFEKLTKENKEIKHINTSTKGAFIEGMQYASLSDVSKNHTECDADINSIILDAIDKNKESWNSVQKELRAVLKKEESTIKDGISNVHKSITAVEEILAIIDIPDADLEKFQKVFKENVDIFSKARQLITKNLLISLYLHNEILEYLKSYHKEDSANLEKLISNFKADLRLFKYTIGTCSVIMPLLENID